MSWHGHLRLSYQLDEHGAHGSPRTVAHDRHSGPLRVLQRLYPEGDAICHHVLVHPPGGIVGGDELHIDADLGPGTHALITTPGATRFYRSSGATAVQDVHLTLAEGARLEWLPLETIAYDGCLAHNRIHATLAPGAEMMGCDILALGLPAADAAWMSGSYLQHVEIQDTWLDRAHLRATDHLLLDGAAGWAGNRVLASLWFASRTTNHVERSTALVEAARARIDAMQVQDAENGLLSHLMAGGSVIQPGLTVLRILAPRVEAVQTLIRAIRLDWRQLAWSLPHHTPRIWGT
jgi:urease accessory protein